MENSDVKLSPLDILRKAKTKGSLSEAFLEHGITDVATLFDSDRYIKEPPHMLGMEQYSIEAMFDSLRHIPFSRIKSYLLNITEEEARAKGYLKGNRTFEEFISALKRSTEPTTIYKLQKIDKDDLSDIKDFDIIHWLKDEMYYMLKEEILRAVFIGDRRSPDDENHINENNIRPILTDDSLYSIHKFVNKEKGVTDAEFLKSFIKTVSKARKEYKGSYTPKLYVSEEILSSLLTLEDESGRFLFDSTVALETILRVSRIVPVKFLENYERTDNSGTYSLLGILVNLEDYTLGFDKSGETRIYEKFDINFSKEQLLIETRLSGALTLPHSAITFEKKEIQHIAVESITLTPDKMLSPIGSTITIKATVKPDNASNKDVIWSSGNTRVANVDQQGVVHNIALGSVDITAKSVDNPKASATIRVRFQG